MSRIHVRHANSGSAANLEDVWFLFTITLFLCFPLKNCADDSPLLIPSRAFLSYCLGDRELCVWVGKPPSSTTWTSVGFHLRQ